jgi:GT2 family glycosyltransferase
MAGIDVLVVIYNKPLAESQTIRTLNAPGDVRIWIADNSTQDCGNRACAPSRGFGCGDMGGNMGLSKAYNRVIDMLDKDDGLVCLFDDDTTVDSRYFEVLRAAAASRPDIDVFAPVVTDRKGILSPCAIRGAACRRVPSLDEMPAHGVSAINSGLAIRRKVFADYRYDEGQFLDYVDHAFMRDITSNERGRIHIMEGVVLRQAFSGSEKQNRAAAMRRYRIFSKDIAYFCRKYGMRAADRQALLIRRRVSLVLRRLMG